MSIMSIVSPFVVFLIKPNSPVYNSWENKSTIGFTVLFLIKKRSFLVLGLPYTAATIATTIICRNPAILFILIAS